MIHVRNSKTQVGFLSTLSAAWLALGASSAALAAGPYTDAQGNVGIGTTSPVNRLDVRGTTNGLGIDLNNAVGPRWIEFTTSNRSNRYAELKEVAWGLSLQLDPAHAFQNNANFSVMGGNVGIGTTTPTQRLEVVGNVKAQMFISPSDVRLKTAIEPAPGLEAILKLQGVRWKWIANGESDAGVIAQDLEKVFPDAVRTDSQGIKGVNYQYLVAPLIESVKELKRENDELKSRLAEIEKKLQAR